MKKILAIVLVCAMFAAVMAGCGAKEKVIIGITDNPPMNYQENGKWTGFETDFTIEVCKILGLEAEFLVIDWGSKEMEVNSGTIDAVWNGMTITPQRAEEMDISIPYMNNGQVLVVRNSDEDKYKGLDLAGANVVAEIGSTLEETIKSHAMFANVNYTGVDKQITGLLEVKAMTADVTLVDLTLAVETIKPGSDYADLTYIEVPDFVEQFGVALRKGSDSFDGAKITLKDLNDAIKKLQDNGKLLEIAKKYNLEDLLVK